MKSSNAWPGSFFGSLLVALSCGGTTAGGGGATAGSGGGSATAGLDGGAAGSGIGGTAGAGGAGVAGSGAVGPCWPTSEACFIAGSSGPGAECMARHDNTGSSNWQGRLTAIEMLEPDKLALEFVQHAIFDNGTSLNQPVCNQNGDGTISWLFELDSAQNKLKLGASPRNDADPKAGFCFTTITNLPLVVAPIEANVAVAGLAFSASAIDINLPIFSTSASTTLPWVLPLRSLTFAGKLNDESHNCIGRYRGDELDPVETCAGRAWETGGTLEAFITVDEADLALMPELGVTLCVFLAGIAEWKGTNSDCASSAKWLAGQRPQADWCSATNSPGGAGCQDAWRFRANFAAASFKLNGDCP